MSEFSRYVRTAPDLLALVLASLSDKDRSLAYKDLAEGTRHLTVKIGRFNHYEVRGFTRIESEKPNWFSPTRGPVGWQTPVYTHHGWVHCSVNDIATADEWYMLRHNVKRPAFAAESEIVDPKTRKRYVALDAIDAATGKVIGRASDISQARALPILRGQISRQHYFLMPGYIVARSELGELKETA
jgi:hypothetical protein